MKYFLHQRTSEFPFIFSDRLPFLVDPRQTKKAWEIVFQKYLRTICLLLKRGMKNKTYIKRWDRYEALFHKNILKYVGSITDQDAVEKPFVKWAKGV